MKQRRNQFQPTSKDGCFEAFCCGILSIRAITENSKNTCYKIIMTSKRRTTALFFMALCVSLTVRLVAAEPENLAAQEQEAFQKAVEHVAPSVVRIETLSRSGDDALTRMIGGPTSGLIVEPSGLILTSAGPFLSKPGTILVQTPDGGRYAGKLLGVDHLRMLALLKIEAPKPLPIPEMLSYKDVRVGVWAIAVGRAFDPLQTNMTVGIVSGLDRIGGKAIQTDAATSPNNYGGPLVDIHGRVLGLVVPLSQKPSETVDVEWYDSGIGFAIPIEHIMETVLPRLKKETDLKPGSLGIAFARSDPNTTEPVVVAVAENSPAAKAKIVPGDRIVAINSHPVARLVELEDVFGTFYAGDVITLTFDHDGSRQEARITLVERDVPKEKPREHQR